MKLVIAEKPSVAQSIARVIGATGRKNGYLEGNGYLVSWCVGHLVELSAPETYDERYSKWRLEDLPILPDSWIYQVSPGTKKQFGILKELMKRPDVESLVCATDAGREGELIFRLVYNQCHCKKPFERLWISSTQNSANLSTFRDNLSTSCKFVRSCGRLSNPMKYHTNISQFKQKRIKIAFFFKKIWSYQKKAVPLHPLSKKKQL